MKFLCGGEGSSRNVVWASKRICLLSGVSESGGLVAGAKVVAVVGGVVVEPEVFGWSLAPHVKETSGPGMMYLVGLRKMLMVMPGSDLLYQFDGEDPPTSSWVPSPETSRLMQ